MYAIRSYYAPDKIHYTNEIHKHMNNLDNDFKKPLTMHMEGYKYKEIAETLDMPIGTVKSRIFFGRKKLQTMID